MGNKQTAVEWLEEKINLYNFEVGMASMRKYIEYAKQMEEQQIKDAVIFGINHGSDESRVFGLDARPYASKQGALYINQTYKTNGK